MSVKFTGEHILTENPAMIPGKSYFTNNPDRMMSGILIEYASSLQIIIQNCFCITRVL